MKSTIIAVSLLVLPSLAQAWVIPGNPDLMPSFGMHAKKTVIAGNRAEIDVTGGPGAPADRIYIGTENRRRDVCGADLRLPVHQSITLLLGYDAVEESEHFVRQGGIHRQDVKLTGYEAEIGIRVYLK